jgi:hypothetical protein
MADTDISEETNHITDFTNKPRFPAVDDPTNTKVPGYIDTDDILSIASTYTDAEIAALGTLGNVSSSGAVTAGNLAVWIDADTIEDGGAIPTGVAPVDPSVVDNIVVFADVDGAQKDSGYSITDLISAGTGNYTITTVTAAYVQLITDQWIIVDKATPMTVTLLEATGSGHPIKVSSIGVGVVTLEVDGAGTINASATIVLNQWETASLCDISAGMYIRELV